MAELRVMENGADALTRRASVDAVSEILLRALGFLIVCVLTMVLYGILSGAVNPPAPRTRSEAVASAMEAATKEQPANGNAWADYAEAVYASGDSAKAFEILSDARESVMDETLNSVNAAEAHLLLLSGKDKQVVANTETYIQKALDLRSEKYKQSAAKGTVVPFTEMDNKALSNLFTFRATAEANLKDYKSAARDYRNALKIDPQAADIRVMLGWVLLESGDRDAARSEFTAALKFLPDDKSAKEGLAAAAKGETSE